MKHQKALNKVKEARARRVSSVVRSAKHRRLAVFRSNRGMYAQVIDDSKGTTLVAAVSTEIKTKGKKTDIAAAVGELIAKKALAAGITEVVFDRRSYRYHGRVKALADAARKGGLKF
ncbi:MAG: Primase/topoisomerase like protein [Candidatus Parcubacteria bacterium]|jgi:large subunit ribosomal protein L18